MVRLGSRYVSSVVFLALAASLVVPAGAQSDKPAASSPPPSSQPSASAAATDSQAQPAQAQPSDDVDPLKRNQMRSRRKLRKSH